MTVGSSVQKECHSNWEISLMGTRPKTRPSSTRPNQTTCITQLELPRTNVSIACNCNCERTVCSLHHAVRGRHSRYLRTYLNAFAVQCTHIPTYLNSSETKPRERETINQPTPISSDNNDDDGEWNVAHAFSRRKIYLIGVCNMDTIGH